MDQPLVSIVVVSYNHSKYIRENLDSIKAQTYPNIELIVADDASQDNSVEVFEAWLAENNYPAKRNFHTKNTGLATMLNECTEMLTGKYVKFIAADDFLHPESIAKCVMKMEELGEDYGLIYTNIITINDASQIIEDFGTKDYYDIWKGLPKEKIREELKKINKIAAPAVLMRTTALRQTGKYDETILIEDYDRWLRINEKFWIYYMPERLTYYRRHTSNISVHKYNTLIFEGIALRMKYNKAGENKEIINGEIRANYLAGIKIPKELLKHYAEYEGRESLLYNCIRSSAPPKFYNFLRNKLL